jgi:hypothetical protein
MTRHTTQKTYRIVQPIQVEHEVIEDYGKRSQYGIQLGWQTTHNRITLVPKTFSLWYGWPGHGKTTIGLCIMAQIAKREKKKFLLYCREEGEAKDITNLLASIWIGRQFYPGGQNRMNEGQLTAAIRELTQYFTILDGRVDGFQGLITAASEAQDETQMRYWGIMADPLNTLVRGSESIAAMYEEGLMTIHDDAKKTGRHYLLFTHPGSDADKKEKTENGITYQPPPTAWNLKGGRTLYDMGYLMIGVWRPPFGLANAGDAYRKNETHLLVQKIKPRGSGEAGATIKLYYDLDRFNYFEIDDKGKESFANGNSAHEMPKPEQIVLPLKPNTTFDAALPKSDRNIPDDDEPIINDVDLPF